MQNSGSFKERFNKVKTAFLDSLAWFLLTSFVGLIQILVYIVLLKCEIIQSPYGLNKFLNDGTLLAYFLAVIGSIVFDTHYVEKDGNRIEIFNNVFFKFFPWFLIVLVVVSTSVNFLKPADKQLPYEAILFQECVLFLSFAYSFFGKFILFMKQNG